MRLVFTILAVVLATTILLSATNYLTTIPLALNENKFINDILKYQLLALSVSLIVLVAILKFVPESKSLLSFGNIYTLATQEKWLGINGKSTWETNGLQFAFFISLATAIFMFLAVKHTNSLSNFQWSFLPLVLLVSLTNSFSEEIIYRFAINGSLMPVMSKISVLLVSAVLFGVPHYFGFPNGIIGVIMSAVLAYVLSKATYETQGIGIAWSIHFLQDLIIFTALFMINVKL